jgi:hypothetical protein
MAALEAWADARAHAAAARAHAAAARDAAYTAEERAKVDAVCAEKVREATRIMDSEYREYMREQALERIERRRNWVHDAIDSNFCDACVVLGASCNKGRSSACFRCREKGKTCRRSSYARWKKYVGASDSDSDSD